MNTPKPFSSDPARCLPAVRTLEDFQRKISATLEAFLLTQAGKDLVARAEWKFAGQEYDLAWSYVFNRARQLGLKYCKRTKRFYKPLPPKPDIGDRVRLINSGATGTVIGCSRFDVVVRLEGDQREVGVSVDFVEKI